MIKKIINKGIFIACKIIGNIKRKYIEFLCCYSRSNSQIPIFHIASMARSGETLLLNCLKKHSRIKVTHNIYQTDEPYENQLFLYLMNFKKKSIYLNCKYLEKYNLKKNSVLILKQSMWEHKYQFNGIVLVRNPLSVYASLRVYDVMEHGNDLNNNWQNYRIPRFLEWLKNIDPGLIDDFLKMDPIDQFCLFYNRRMIHLSKLGLPIIYYEEFVNYPERELKRICRYMQIEFEKEMLNPQEKNKHDLGHGNIDLNRSIDTTSVYKYRKILTKDDVDHIVKNTEITTSIYGYILEWDKITINKLV